MSGSTSPQNGQEVFNWLDALILTVVAILEIDNAPANLTDILYGSDAIGRVLLTFQELNQGLGKLLRTGYIIRDDINYRTTQAVSDCLHKEPDAAGRDSRVIQNRMWELLDVKSHDQGMIPQEGRDCLDVVSEAEYSVAVAEYHGRWERYLRDRGLLKSNESYPEWLGKKHTDKQS